MEFFKVLLIFTIFFLVACEQEIHDKYYPSDYLYLQRTYPHGHMDEQAYSDALEWRNKSLENNRSGKSNWRSLGPLNLSGRISDIEVKPGEDNIILAGSASGGIFRSDNYGASWQPVFDQADYLSIGDIAIAPSDPNIVYAGTGESNAGGGSIAYDGKGIYRSDDGGYNWYSIGPNITGSTGRIAIDPENPERLYLAWMGPLFKATDEQGIYRSIDGGDNWEQVLFLTDSTGGIDLVVHPQNADIVYAAMWERIRRPYNRQYGGASSGIYRSLDGGTNWQELSVGLPGNADDKGRIGLDISESDPHILMAYYADTKGNLEGIYRSEDAGNTWVSKSVEGINNVSFMWWFGRIYIHPQDPAKIFATSLNMFYSDDEAESWQQIFNSAHVDHHAMAFSDSNPGLVYNGNDGGVYSSDELGLSAEVYLNGMPNFQFYTCTIDPTDASIIYGGAQDNGIVRTRSDDGQWDKIFGGDGFHILVDPDNPDRIYFETQNGLILRSENGGENPEFAAIGISGQFNWNTPLEMHPHNSDILYTGTQKLYRSVDRARSWEAISPELVSSDEPSGNLVFGTLTSIELSTLEDDLIYIGTDKGKVWRSLDGGDSYDEISSGLPQRWVTSIEADPHQQGSVYLTVSGFRFGESDAQVYYSSDYGDHWLPVSGNLPDIPVNKILADDMIEAQLYVATDIGIYYSVDRGRNWAPLSNGLPNTIYTDLDFHSDARILVAASYGRGMFTLKLDDLSATERHTMTDLSVFPNPASDRIFIHTGLDVHDISLFGLDGKCVKSQDHNSVFSLNGLPSGCYILKIRLENDIYSKMIYIN